jgi:hypothetical protein
MSKNEKFTIYDLIEDVTEEIRERTTKLIETESEIREKIEQTKELEKKLQRHYMILKNLKEIEKTDKKKMYGKTEATYLLFHNSTKRKNQPKNQALRSKEFDNLYIKHSCIIKNLRLKTNNRKTTLKRMLKRLNQKDEKIILLKAEIAQYEEEIRQIEKKCLDSRNKVIA